MKVRAAEGRDIDRIWPNIAQRMLDEYRHAGYPNVAQVRGIFRAAFKAGRGVAYSTDDDVPLAVMMWDTEGGMVSTGFAATDEFFSPRYVLPFSRLLRQFQLDRGNPPLISHSFSEHPAVPKWFKTLGFRLSSEDGVHRVFVRDPLKVMATTK